MARPLLFHGVADLTPPSQQNPSARGTPMWANVRKCGTKPGETTPNQTNAADSPT